MTLGLDRHLDLNVLCYGIDDQKLPLFSAHAIYIMPDVKVVLLVQMREMIDVGKESGLQYIDDIVHQ